MSHTPDLDNDLQAIEQLHQQDMAAAKMGDFETLRSLMTDDAVVMPPGSHWLRGKAERDASFQNMQVAMSQVDVLEYRLDFEEVTILGDYAFEWGTIRGATRPKNGGDVETSSYKVMRILQRQVDGEWKVHRTIWNDNPPLLAQKPS
jgi:uncharacterized protein (TIGR02246 family)